MYDAIDKARHAVHRVALTDAKLERAQKAVNAYGFPLLVHLEAIRPEPKSKEFRAHADHELQAIFRERDDDIRELERSIQAELGRAPVTWPSERGEFPKHMNHPVSSSLRGIND